MVFKKILLIILLISNCFGDILHDKIKNLIGDKNYKIHKNLIDNLTKNQNYFYTANGLNYSAILKMLKEQGLISLEFNAPKEVSITFVVKNNYKKALKILKETLNTLGYTYYFTDFFTNSNNTLKWKIRFKSDFMLDPYIFNNELNKTESQIIDIVKISNYEWLYKINVENSKLYNSIKIEKNEKVKLLKPLKPYLLYVNDAKELIVLSRKLNSWFPKLAFYSKELKVLGVVEKNRIYRGVKIKIPENTSYIKIDDSFTLLNIKRGLTIIVR